MKYYIAIEELRSTVVAIEADNPEAALSKAEKAYAEDRICLDAPDYIDDGTTFNDETEKWSRSVEKGYANFQIISD